MLFCRYNDLLQLTTKLQYKCKQKMFTGKQKGEFNMRKTRSDCTLKTLIKKTGIPGTAFRNPNGRKTRIDKLVGTMRKEIKIK